MATKYIVNNVTGQTIDGGLKISGDTYVITTPPTSITGSTGDTIGKLAIDGDYLYYCVEDFVAPINDPIVISGGTPTHVFDAEPSTEWNGYGDNYLQVGPSQEESVVPQNGWYIVDDNGTIREVIGGFWLSPAAPAPNGTGWIMTLDGPFTYSVSNPTITFYETLPTVTGGSTPGSGDIWRTVKLDKTLNTTVTYKALLTQTGNIIGYNLGNFYGGLIIGEEYTITNYQEGDDFSNIANVTSGNINETGCVFIATGEIPTNYNNGSELSSLGDLVVNVLENTLGYDLYWGYDLFGPGIYFAISNPLNPIPNSFPRNYVSSKAQTTQSFDYYPSILTVNASPASYLAKDDSFVVTVWDDDNWDYTNNRLYYMPIEISIKVDVTPVIITPTLNNSYPFNNASFNLGCNGSSNSYYSNDGTTVNNAQELAAVLNSSNDTNFLGTFSDDGLGNIILTMTTSTKQQYCQDNTLTIEIFQD
jgi:hypothetical protein